MSGSPAGWPKDVEPLSIESLEKLGIDSHNELFWNGQRIVTRNKLSLTRVQAFLAVLAALGTIASGINNAALFLCARDLHWLSCPVAVPAVVPAAK